MFIFTVTVILLVKDVTFILHGLPQFFVEREDVVFSVTMPHRIYPQWGRGQISNVSQVEFRFRLASHSNTFKFLFFYC